MAARTLTLHACDCRFDLHCDTDHTRALLAGVFGGLTAAASARAVAHRAYHIERSASTGYTVSSADSSVALADTAQLLEHIDKGITIELQLVRRDLLFVHGAVLAWNNRAVVISAPPGTGKSTVTLVALQSGLEYFSDELAPIDLQRLTVYTYPRALHLKTPPPAPYVLPASAMEHSGRYYVEATSSNTARGQARLHALIFLRRDRDTFRGLRSISPASGAAYLIANTLNLLAHSAVGLDAAAALSRGVACFELDATDLTGAGEAIRAALTAPRLSGVR